MEIKFKMTAWCAAAGRKYNEDSYQLNVNLSDSNWGFTDDVVSLSDKGALLVVCDGMGGMSAGEVASELAVETIREQFTPERLTPQVLSSRKTIMRYIENAIIAADEKIKEDGKQHKERQGMGSTIVLAWIIGKNIYVGWCGDSRAYRFNPAFGLEPLTSDHSYVQELVDSGKLSAELAFDHPDSNIITRSLGDTRQKARPDTDCFPLYNEDIILLCSDGLSGVLRDSEIQAIIAEHADSLENCRSALWHESEKAGWTDNVTIAMCQIISGADTAPKYVNNNNDDSQKKNKKKSPLINIVIAILLSIILGFGGGYAFWKWSSNDVLSEPGNEIVDPDDTKENPEEVDQPVHSQTQPTNQGNVSNSVEQITDTPSATENVIVEPEGNSDLTPIPVAPADIKAIAVETESTESNEDEDENKE